MNELNTPRWNLDKLFTSIESDKYKQAVELLKTGIEKLQSLLKNSNRFNFSFWLNGYLTAYDKVYALMQTLSCYASIIYSVDTTNSAILNNLSVIDEFGIQFSQIELSFKNILYRHRDELDAFFVRFPQFSDRKYLLELQIAEFKHQMSPKEELLTGSLQKTGGNAWELLQAQIISNLADEKGKTFNELRNDAYSSDPALRKSSYEKELALLKANRIALAACLNNLKGETVYLNKRRKWRSAIDRALLSNRLSKPTLNALIKAIEKSLPSFRKYFLAKAKFLKKHNMTASFSADKGLAFYDLFAPMTLPTAGAGAGDAIRAAVGATGAGAGVTAGAAVRDAIGDATGDAAEASAGKDDKNSILTKTWTFDQARDYIIARYTSFSVHMGSFAKKAFEENWIDAEVRPGKVGGAFDEDFALGHQSRILTNFTGTFSDIITLAHELGHAYHFSCLRGKPPLFASYPMTLAETASTFAETIVKQDLLSKCTPAERLQLLDMDLQDVSQVLVDILCRYYFEKSVFTEREKNPLTADDFCRLMQAAQEKSYGKGLNSERHEYMWAVKSHYYSTGLDFYNFPYAFGQLFAMALYQRYKKEGAGFAATYAKLLSNTGSMSCEDLCREAGFDITQVEFWQGGIQAYLEEVDEFISLVNEKGAGTKQAE